MLIDDIFCVLRLYVGCPVFCPAQVPCTSASLNTGDVFILDAGLQLYLWNGPDANMYEKSKGALAMQRIKVRGVAPKAKGQARLSLGKK